MTRSEPKMGLVEWTLLIVLSIVWGGSFFFAKVAVAEVPPITIVAVRVSLAAAALFIVLRASGIAMPAGRGDWGAFFIMGFMNNGGAVQPDFLGADLHYKRPCVDP